ncbi:MAG TPA: FtsQ-type POTRA domain-containing protein [Tissierellaceae bacterium]|nr:FtsQ-type POTRA domain-containing protein [Tissierellaceae bacterium]
MKKMTRVQRKKRRRRIFLRIMLLVSLLFIIFILALKTEFFLIDNIKVMGNKKLIAKTIIDASNIEKKDNIFKISIKNSEKAIEELPYIKEVKIKRKLPKALIINVVERKGALQIKNISSYIILDKEGYILDIVSDKNNKFTELIGFHIENKVPGDNLFLDLEQFNANFIEEGENLNLLSQMEEINLLDDNNINILLLNGIDVAFGTIDNVKYKLSLLKEVLRDIEKKDLQCKMILMDRGENPIIVLEDEEG